MRNCEEVCQIIMQIGMDLEENLTTLFPNLTTLSPRKVPRRAVFPPFPRAQLPVRHSSANMIDCCYLTRNPSNRMGLWRASFSPIFLVSRPKPCALRGCERAGRAEGLGGGFWDRVIARCLGPDGVVGVSCGRCGGPSGLRSGVAPEPVRVERERRRFRRVRSCGPLRDEG